MVKPQTDAFWKALVFTFIVFIIGVYLGVVMEDFRLNKIQEEFDDLVIRWGDIRLQSYYYQSIDQISCEEAIDENLRLGDRIYEDGLKLGEIPLEPGNTTLGASPLMLANSLFTDIAEIDRARNKLAEKKIKIAELYLLLEQQKGAEIYFESIVNQFYDTKYLEDALLNVAYIKAGTDKEAAINYLETNRSFFESEDKFKAAISKIENKQ